MIAPDRAGRARSAATGTGRRRQRLPHRPASRTARPAASPCSPPTRTCSARSAATVADGTWLNAATGRYPAVVLGARRGRAARASPAAGRQVLARRALVHRRRHPDAGAAGARAGLAPRWSAGPGRRGAASASTATRRTVYTRSADGRRRRRSARCSPPPPTRRHPNEVKVSPARPTRWPPSGRRHSAFTGAAARASARSPCWSAASAWPTPW